MGRSVKKGPFVDPKLLAKVMKQKDTNNREPLKTWARASTITPEFVGHTFMVHNGNKFLKVFVIADRVGHKLGEFSHSRTFRGHTSKKAAAPGAAAPAAGK